MELQHQSFQLIFRVDFPTCSSNFPGDSDGKSVCLQCGRSRFNPRVGKILWRRQWQPTPVLLPGKSHGRRSLAGCSPWGCKESDMTERLKNNMMGTSAAFKVESWCRWQRGVLGWPVPFCLGEAGKKLGVGCVCIWHLRLLSSQYSKVGGLTGKEPKPKFSPRAAALFYAPQEHSLSWVITIISQKQIYFNSSQKKTDII